MNDDTDSQAEKLASARARSDAEFEALAGKVARRQMNSVLTLHNTVRHERWLVDLILRRMKDLEEVIATKDSLVSTYRATSDGWQEIATAARRLCGRRARAIALIEQALLNPYLQGAEWDPHLRCRAALKG